MTRLTIAYALAGVCRAADAPRCGVFEFVRPTTAHETILRADRGGYRPKGELFEDIAHDIAMAIEPFG